MSITPVPEMGRSSLPLLCEAVGRRKPACAYTDAPLAATLPHFARRFDQRRYPVRARRTSARPESF